MTVDAGGTSWSSTLTRSRTGAFNSAQRIAFPMPVVERSAEGARRLGELYWSEVERATLRVVRTCASDRGLEVLLFGVGPARAAGSNVVSCVYPILGGLLTRVAAGSISFVQSGSDAVEVTSSIEGFFPRLAGRRWPSRWNALLYSQVQSRLHVALGRRYFARLWREAHR